MHEGKFGVGWHSMYECAFVYGYVYILVNAFVFMHMYWRVRGVF